MKKQIFLILAVILGVAIAWSFLAHRTPKTSTINPTPAQIAQQQRTEQNASNSLIAINQQSQSNPAAKSDATNELKEYIKKLRQDPSYEWKLPIDFFGKVVDDSNEPIASADIHFEWNTVKGENISGETLDTRSDGSGFFELRNQKGDPLSVSVSKQGYYPKTGSFWYNPDRGPFRPDQNNPYVFHLHKKGPGVVLITSQDGVASNFHVHIPRDGIPTKVDLMQRQIGDTGQLIVTENKPEYKDWQQASQWSFQVEIPDGGFIGENDEYPYEAPTDGYESVVKFDFQKDNSNWATGINTNFYIKFGNPPLYGRLQVQTDITYRGAIFTYVINPSGSQNLEPAQ